MLLCEVYLTKEKLQNENPTHSIKYFYRMTTRERREEYTSSNVVRVLHPSRPLSPNNVSTDFDNNLGELQKSLLHCVSILYWCFSRCTLHGFFMFAIIIYSCVYLNMYVLPFCRICILSMLYVTILFIPSNGFTYLPNRASLFYCCISTIVSTQHTANGCDTRWEPTTHQWLK